MEGEGNRASHFFELFLAYRGSVRVVIGPPNPESSVVYKSNCFFNSETKNRKINSSCDKKDSVTKKTLILVRFALMLEASVSPLYLVRHWPYRS